jgi:hypothetical protein
VWGVRPGGSYSAHNCRLNYDPTGDANGLRV